MQWSSVVCTMATTSLLTRLRPATSFRFSSLLSLSSAASATWRPASSLRPVAHSVATRAGPRNNRSLLVCGLAVTTAAATATLTSLSSVSCTPLNDDNDTNESSASASAADPVETVQVQPFDESVLEFDHYNGVALYLDRLPADDNNDDNDDDNVSATAPANFTASLEAAMNFWKLEGRKGIWMYVPAQHADKIPIAVAAGFDFHMVKAVPRNDAASQNTLVLKAWLPASASRLPSGPHHQVGVGCVVLHPTDDTKMLVVQEKTGPAAAYKLWKMPTGLVDQQEDIHDAAVRELQEETGLQASFDSILCFRQAHRGSRASDLFFVCRLQLLEQDADKMQDSMLACPHEIAAMQWMSVQEYCDQKHWQTSPVYQELNAAVLNAAHHAAMYKHTLALGDTMGRNVTNTLYKSQL